MVRADVVTLNGGNSIYGEILSQDTASLRIKTPTGTLEFPVSRVSKTEIEPKGITQARFGKAYFDRKNYELSVRAYEKAVEAEPGNQDYSARLELARKSLLTAKSMAAENILAQGDQYLKNGRNTDAIEIYSKITTEGYADIWVKKANAGIAKVKMLMASKTIEPTEREKLVDEALSLDPESADAHYEKGMIFLQKGTSADARSEFEMALNLDQGNAKALRILGNLAFADKDYLKASDYYEKLKTASSELYSGVKPNLAICYTELGNAAYKDENLDEAKLWLEKAVEIDPNGNWSILFQTQYLLRKRDIDPTSADDHFNLGLWCQDKKLIQEAMSEFKTAYQLNPGMYKAKLKILELNDKLATSLYQVGMQSLGQRNFTQAIASFNQIIKDYPESSYAPDAKRLIQGARAQWAEFLFADAKASFEAGYMDRANQGFTKIVEEFSDTPRFVDAQRMLNRTQSKIKYEQNTGGDRQRKLDQLKDIYESAYGRDSSAWAKIYSLQNLPANNLEYALARCTVPEKQLIMDNLDKVIYLFYDKDKNIDKLRPLAIRFGLPVSDRSKIRSDADYAKVLQLALMLSVSMGTQYYNGWRELIPYFGSNRSELDDVKKSLSKDATDLLDERGGEVYKLLNIRQ
jgi:tetratricopeptide (TPR) repeat protein